MIAHGHGTKEYILNNYSKEDITMFYEQCIKHDMRGTADFSTGVSLGIATAFGGSGAKKVAKIIEDMRKQ